MSRSQAGKLRNIICSPWIICLAIALLLNGYFIFSQLNKTPALDEVEFIEAARAISKSGVPYSGFWRTPDGMQIWSYTMWHPPLYQYVSTLGLKLFTPDWAGIRLVQYVFFIGAMILLYFLFSSKNIFDTDTDSIEQRNTIASCVLFLTLINPFIIQSVLLIDIDNNIFLFFIALFLFFLVQKKDNTGVSACLILGFLFSLVLWTKMTSSPALPVIVFLYYLPRIGIRKTLSFVLKIFFIGIISFVVSYWLFTLLTATPFTQPFKHILRSLSPKSGSIILKFIGMIKEALLLFVWITPAICLLIAIGVCNRIYNVIKMKKLAFLDILVIFGLIICFGYIAISATPFNFHKYQGFTVPFLLLSVAPQAMGVLRKFSKTDGKKIVYLSIFMLLLAFVYSYFVIDDPLYSLRSGQFDQSTLLRLLIILGLIVPLPMVFLCFKRLNLGMKTQELWIMAAFLVTVASSLSLSFCQARADYSTNYYYGERGLKQTIDFVTARYGTVDMIFARKDIGWASDGKWFQACDYLSESPYSTSKLEEFKELLYSVKPSILIISYRRSGIRSQNYLQKLRANVLNPSGYENIKKIGDFEIYKKKSR